MQAEVTAENLGPIESVTVGFKEHGITVLTAPNGSGKSIFLQSVQALVEGNGRVPLRDGADKGFVEGFGARISLGSQIRHRGEAQVMHLEGRFDLAALVDPGIQNPEAADRARIRAMVALCGVKADVALFAEHKEFADIGSVGSRDVRNATDLVDMAAKVKRDYEAVAREAENEVALLEGQIRANETAISTVDTSAPHDQLVLNAALDTALDQQRTLQVRAKEWAERQQQCQESQGRIEQTRKQLEVLGSRESIIGSIAEKRDAKKSAMATVASLESQIADLQAKLDAMYRSQQSLDTQLEMLEQKLKHHDSLAGVIQEADSVLKAHTGAEVTQEQVDAAAEQVAKARAAVEMGVRVRDALALQEALEQIRERVRDKRACIERWRKAAQSVDRVLSGAIKVDSLHVVTNDKGAARLMVNHPKRGETPYGELSAGERWKIAIDLGADVVGEDGLLVIPQEAWEALDVFARKAVDEHARERKVYVLTAEATRDPSLGRGFELEGVR